MWDPQQRHYRSAERWCHWEDVCRPAGCIDAVVTKLDTDSPQSSSNVTQTHTRLSYDASVTPAASLAAENTQVILPAEQIHRGDTRLGADSKRATTKKQAYLVIWSRTGPLPGAHRDKQPGLACAENGSPAFLFFHYLFYPSAALFTFMNRADHHTRKKDCPAFSASACACCSPCILKYTGTMCAGPMT